MSMRVPGWNQKCLAIIVGLLGMHTDACLEQVLMTSPIGDYLYQLTDIEHNERPVYQVSSSGAASQLYRYIYFHEDNENNEDSRGWYVGSEYDNGHGELRSSTRVGPECPYEDDRWLIEGTGGVWVVNDTFHFSGLLSCGEVFPSYTHYSRSAQYAQYRSRASFALGPQTTMGVANITSCGNDTIIYPVQPTGEPIDTVLDSNCNGRAENYTVQYNQTNYTVFDIGHSYPFFNTNDWDFIVSITCTPDNSERTTTATRTSATTSTAPDSSLPTRAPTSMPTTLPTLVPTMLTEAPSSPIHTCCPYYEVIDNGWTGWAGIVGIYSSVNIWSAQASCPRPQEQRPRQWLHNRNFDGNGNYSYMYIETRNGTWAIDWNCNFGDQPRVRSITAGLCPEDVVWPSLQIICSSTRASNTHSTSVLTPDPRSVATLDSTSASSTEPSSIPTFGPTTLPTSALTWGPTSGGPTAVPSHLATLNPSSRNDPQDYSADQSSSDSTLIVVVIVVCALVLAVILALFVHYRRSQKSNATAVPPTFHFENSTFSIASASEIPTTNQAANTPMYGKLNFNQGRSTTGSPTYASLQFNSYDQPLASDTVQYASPLPFSGRKGGTFSPAASTAYEAPKPAASGSGVYSIPFTTSNNFPSQGSDKEDEWGSVI